MRHVYIIYNISSYKAICTLQILAITGHISYVSGRHRKKELNFCQEHTADVSKRFNVCKGAEMKMK